MLDDLTTDDRARRNVRALVERATSESELERTASSDAGEGLEKRGAFTGSFVINPFTNEPVPVYVADYVLGTYGTGAIMAVPAEDERDFAFASAYGLPIVRTVAAARGFRRWRLHRRRRAHQLGLPRRPRRCDGQGRGGRVPRRARPWHRTR